MSQEEQDANAAVIAEFRANNGEVAAPYDDPPPMLLLHTVGARTGRASVVTALCFLPCLFIAPLAAAVPSYATAAVLVLVGLSMFQMVGALDFRTIEDSLPPFVTIVLIPLTLSITQGILWGFILHALLYVVAGRHRELSPTLWILAAISVGLLGLESQ